MPIEKLKPTFSFTEERLRALEAVVPEAFVDGRINWETLREILGDRVEGDEVGAEHFGLFWPGKREARRLAAQLSKGTLVHSPGEGVDEETTENIFIEGDNLEVLKLLQKSYAGRIKMIYIDPPYNTGVDYIYKDNFAEPLENYLKRTGQMGEEGELLTTNTKSDGRFHSKWLNMMYPRLYLARNLLRDDGVIFISIDDNEVSNLRRLCDEIFGEENFIGLFVVNSSPSAIDYGHIAKMHDYALFYAKSIDETTTSQLLEEDKKFKYEDETGPFNLYPLYNGNVAFNPKTRPNLYYPFYLNPSNKIGEDFYEIGLESREDWVQVYPVVSKKDAIQRVWRWGRDLSRKHLNQEIVGYKTEDGEFRVVQKTRHTGKVIRSLQIDKDISTRRGTAEVESLFGAKLFPFPKPIELIKRFIEVGAQEDCIVLDFFAGSGTTAHAVMDLNREDGKRREFICVQLPERLDPAEGAFREGFRSLTDLSKERIRRASKKVRNDVSTKLRLDSQQLDLGFKVLRLDKSNFRAWQDFHSEDLEQLETLFATFETPLVEGWKEQDVLTEILLIEGFPLNSKGAAALDFISNKVIQVESDFSAHRLFICLDSHINDRTICNPPVFRTTHK